MIVPRDGKKVLLRLPDEMLAKLNQLATRNGRSRNTEIIQLISTGLRDNTQPKNTENQLEQ